MQFYIVANSPYLKHVKIAVILFCCEDIIANFAVVNNEQSA